MYINKFFLKHDAMLVHTYACIYTYTYTHTHIYIYTYIFTYTHTYLPTIFPCICMHVRICVYLNFILYVCMFILDISNINVEPTAITHNIKEVHLCLLCYCVVSSKYPFVFIKHVTSPLIMSTLNVSWTSLMPIYELINNNRNFSWSFIILVLMGEK